MGTGSRCPLRSRSGWRARSPATRPATGWGAAGVTLFVGRLTAGARVLLPGLAGASRVPYRTFLVWNALAGATWATAHVMLGYLAGESWHRIHDVAGRAALYLLGGLALLAALTIGIRLLVRRHRRQVEAPDDPDRTSPISDKSKNPDHSRTGS